MSNGSSVYSSLECTSGCHHIVFSPEVQKKSVFVTPIGKFQLKKVPFSLAQTLTHFQQLITEILKGLPFAFRYLDNILLFTENTDKHFEHLRAMLNRLTMVDLKFKRKKCSFLGELHYLGHLNIWKMYLFFT